MEFSGMFHAPFYRVELEVISSEKEGKGVFRTEFLVRELVRRFNSLGEEDLDGVNEYRVSLRTNRLYPPREVTVLTRGADGFRMEIRHPEPLVEEE